MTSIWSSTARSCGATETWMKLASTTSQSGVLPRCSRHRRILLMSAAQSSIGTLERIIHPSLRAILRATEGRIVTGTLFVPRVKVLPRQRAVLQIDSARAPLGRQAEKGCPVDARQGGHQDPRPAADPCHVCRHRSPQTHSCPILYPNRLGCGRPLVRSACPIV